MSTEVLREHNEAARIQQAKLFVEQFDPSIESLAEFWDRRAALDGRSCEMIMATLTARALRRYASLLKGNETRP